jgi:hypothetical protein
MDESDEEEVVTTEMSEAAKCRVRNRAMRKAREAAAMEEVMAEEYGRSSLLGVPTSTIVGVAVVAYLFWRWIGS